jgi:hypothetical protein
MLMSTAFPAKAYAPSISGTYTTASVSQGTFKFTAVKAVVQFGYQGNFVISGKKYPGVLYTIRGTSNMGMAWYYGVTGITAGSAIVSPVGGGAYKGTIEFFDKRGNVTSSGTIDVILR